MNRAENEVNSSKIYQNKGFFDEISAEINENAKDGNIICAVLVFCRLSSIIHEKCTIFNLNHTMRVSKIVHVLFRRRI